MKGTNLGPTPTVCQPSDFEFFAHVCSLPQAPAVQTSAHPWSSRRRAMRDFGFLLSMTLGSDSGVAYYLSGGNSLLWHRPTLWSATRHATPPTRVRIAPPTQCPSRPPVPACHVGHPACGRNFTTCQLYPKERAIAVRRLVYYTECHLRAHGQRQWSAGGLGCMLAEGGVSGDEARGTGARRH